MIILGKHFADKHVCPEDDITSVGYSSTLLPTLALLSNDRQDFHKKEVSNFSRDPSAWSQHPQDDRMNENGSDAQFDKESEKHGNCQYTEYTSHHPDPEEKSHESLPNQRFICGVNKNQCSQSFLTHSTFVGKTRRKYNFQVGKGSVVKWNKGNERVDCSVADLPTTAFAAEDKCRDNNHAYNYNRENPVTCRKRNGHGHCRDVNSKSGISAQNTLALRQSNSQSDSQDNDWFSAAEAELSYSSVCGGGENNLMMESGIQHMNSRDRETKTKLVSSPPTTSTSAVASRYFACEPVNKSDCQVEKKSLSKNSIYSRTSTNHNYYTRKCRGRISNSSNDAIAISSTVAVSNLCRLIFNFILLTSFLLLNSTCQVVQGEIFSAPTNERLDSFLMHARNNNYDYNNNIENKSLTLLPTVDASSPSPSNIRNSNQHRNKSFSIRDNTISDNKPSVDNHYDFNTASLRNVENERKLSKSSIASATAEETLRDLLSQPLDHLNKDVLLKVTFISFC